MRKVDDLKKEIDEERVKNSEETIKLNKLERDFSFQEVSNTETLWLKEAEFKDKQKDFEKWLLLEDSKIKDF